MSIIDLKQRTKKFALDGIAFVESLPRRRTAEIIGGQLLRSVTSAGANYRSACRARSAADFISKMTVVEEEIDESVYWLELLVESKIVGIQSAQSLMKEGNELLAITIASIKTARKNRKQ